MLAAANRASATGVSMVSFGAKREATREVALESLAVSVWLVDDSVLRAIDLADNSDVISDSLIVVPVSPLRTVALVPV